MSNEICQFHEDENNLGFCFKSECQYSEYCYDCKSSGIHQNHQDSCLSYKQIMDKLENLHRSLYEQKYLLLPTLQKVTGYLTEFLHQHINLKIDECIDLKQIFYNEDHSSAKNKFEQLKQYVYFDFEKQRQSISEIQNKCERFLLENQINLPQSEFTISESLNSKILQINEQIQNNSSNEDNQSNQNQPVERIEDDQNDDNTLEQLDLFLQEDPNNEEVLFVKGEILFQQNQFSESLACFDQVQRLNSKNHRVLIYRADILNNQGKAEEADEAYRQAIIKYPQEAKLYSNRANNLNKLMRYLEAINLCDQSIGIDLRNANAYNNKGFALLKLQKYQDALVNFDLALKFEKNLPDIWSNKGQVLLKMNRIQEAQDCMNIIQSLSLKKPRFNSLAFQIQLLTNQGNYQEALEICHFGILSFPNQEQLLTQKNKLERILRILNY